MFNSSVAITLLRYALGYGATYVAGRGWVDGATAQAVVATVVAAAAAGYGAWSSTDKARVAATLSLPSVRSVELDSGRTVTDPVQVNSAMNDR